MGEFASSGVGTAGLTTGVIGTALGALNSGIFGGDGGGLFGGGGKVSALQAEIAQLKSEKYADKDSVEVYTQARREITDLGDRLLGNWIKPLSQEAAANRERLASLEAKVDGNFALQQKDLELMRKDVEISRLQMNAKIDGVANMATAGITANSTAIAALERVVGGITCTRVCKDAICPEVMPRWNAWEAPTAVAPATQPVTGNINAM